MCKIFLSTFALTSIVAHNEVDIGAKGEGAEVSVAHEILQCDALHNPRVTHHLASTLGTKARYCCCDSTQLPRKQSRQPQSKFVSRGNGGSNLSAQQVIFITIVVIFIFHFVLLRSFGSLGGLFRSGATFSF